MFDDMMHGGSAVWMAMAIGLLALAMLVAGGAMLWRAMRQDRSRQVVDRAIGGRVSAVSDTGVAQEQGLWTDALLTAASLGSQWLSSRFGDVLLAPEDRQAIEACGFRAPARARALFAFARVALGLGVPLAGLFWIGEWFETGNGLLDILLPAFLGFGIGWMLPKWYVGRRARLRRIAANEELPLLIDLLRLLQSVGLSIDQSLHVVVHEFVDVMPVLSMELDNAVQQHARGRTREQSLARLMQDFDNDDLGAVCRLIIQVDQHGGAMQEPLQAFSERLRERRKMEMKEKTGKLTVKMTGVMVVTLLPALIIVTGGPGFLAVIRGLTHFAGGGS